MDIYRRFRKKLEDDAREAKKKKSLAQLPEVMSYLIMSLRINPNLERAVEFASSHSQGLFKERLDGIISNVQMGRESAEDSLLKLAEDFKKWDEFKRSMRLVIASTQERTEERRQETLDKATDVLLGGLAARTEKEARALHTPVMIVFTFGVILPLIFITLIPFMSLMGIEVGAGTVGIMYTVGLPLFLFFMIKFIASNRPATMTPPDVPSEKSYLPLVVAVVAGLALSLPLLAGEALGSMRFVPILWGVGAGVGLFLVLSTFKVKRMRKRIKGLEKDFGETLHQLGIILSEGRPLENALANSDSEFLKQASSNIQTLNTDLKSAFFDERFGSLREVYSHTIKGVMDTIISVSDKGSDAMAKVSFRMSEHLTNLKKSEAEIERSLGSVVSSMKIIAMVVAPLVGGMISSMSIVLANTMAETGENAAISGMGMGNVIDPSLITLIIGIYAAESAVILVMFGADLMHGDDKVMKKYGIGLALPIAVLVFTICAWIASSLFGGIA